MNINYHYFAVKTLGIIAGLREDVAQKIAYYSQMVDDFSCDRPTIFVKEKPDDFFFEIGVASDLKCAYSFNPIQTAISTIRTIEPIHCKKTIVPFHFVPQSKIKNVEKKVQTFNDNYLCQKATGDEFLIWEEVNDTVNRLLETNTGNDYDIVNLGMLFHVFADTFAHYGFSGLHGKENWAKIKALYLNGKEVDLDKSFKDKIIQRSDLCPEIGHACLLHLPDAAGYTINAYRYEDETKGTALLVTRNNRDTFMNCSIILFDWLEKLGKKFGDGKSEGFGEDAQQLFADTLCAASCNYNETTDVNKLAEIWKKSYPDIDYSYVKNIYNLSDRMDQIIEPYANLTSEELELLDTCSFDDMNAIEFVEKIVINPSKDFFYFNKAAYTHRKNVIGYYNI